MNNIGLRLTTMLLLVLACCGCTSGGATDFDGLLGQDANAPAAMPTTLTLTGPTTVAPGVNTSGYVATYTPGTRGKANPGIRIEFNAAGNANNVGNIVVVLPCGAGGNEQPASGGGTTDKQGRVCFNYTAPSSVTAPVTITLFATVPGQVDAANNTLMKTLAVTVQPATFQFVQPTSNNIGLDARKSLPLHFQWTQTSSSGSGTEGVSGKVQLSASGGGQFTIDGVASGNPIIVDTSGGADSMGDFARAIGIFGTSSGAVGVTATDQSNGRNSTLTFQARDTPTGVGVDANPAQVTTGGSPRGGQSNVTITVTGANGAVANAAVTFTLAKARDGSTEQLSRTSGTTNNQGQLITVYSSGPDTGTATVEACVNDSTVCGSGTITVVAP